VDELVARLLERSGYLEHLDAAGEAELAERRANVEELGAAAAAFAAAHAGEDPAAAGLLAWLSECALLTDADRTSEGDRALLLTVHNAKGLEFDAVFVIGMEQNLFPHARSIEEANLEEERRLCYVAITRARRELTLVYARQRTLFGARGFNAPSQFLAEIPENLVEHERRAPAFGSSPRGGSSRAGDRAGWQPSSAGATTQLAGIAPRDDAPQLSVGDNVLHDQLGEGVVTGTADGGQVIVRFRSDGSERRLLLAYAPLKRL